MTPKKAPADAANDLPQDPGAPDVDSLDPGIAALSYEEARDELVGVVQRLEGGAESLEQSLALWERGEALARHCERWLNNAQARLDAATQDGPA